ncbi:MAG: DHA2 family efflux MFS transporter permease subunit, partial [Alphaproteobacteria bacterium]
LTGWLVARFGRRRVLIVSVATFTATALLCGLATSFEAMILYRIVQGGSAAAMVALPQAVIFDTYPRERHAFAQSVWGMAVVVGPAMAPSIGGFISDLYGWRMAFLMMLPIGTLALTSTVLVVRDAGREEGKRLDWTGFLALAAAIACMQIAFDLGNRLDWFDSSSILLLMAAAAAAFYVFVVQCVTARDPFVNLRIFLNRNYALGLVLVFVYGLLQIAPTVILPPFLRTLKGYPDTLIGIVLAMRGAGMFLGFILAPHVARLDPRIGVGVGVSLTVWSGWLMAHLTFDSSMADIAVAGIIQGLGASTFWVPLSTYSFATMPRHLLPQATGIYHLARTFGMSLFVAICVAVVLWSARITYSELSPNLSVFNGMLAYPGVTGGWALGTLPQLAGLEAEIGRQALMIGYQNAFLTYAAVAAAVLPLLLLIRPSR